VKARTQELQEKNEELAPCKVKGTQAQIIAREIGFGALAAGIAHEIKILNLLTTLPNCPS